MRRVFVITCGLVLVLILALSLHNSNNTAASSTQSHSHSSRFRGAHKDKHRIAIVIPFYGETVEAIPPYFNLFLTSAAGSAKLVDFLLIHNGVLDVYPKQLVPPNVHLISTGSTKAFIELLLRVMNDKKDNDLKVGSRDELIKIVSYHIHQYPYVLVEFKPATGHIFASQLEGYSHWGYADLDIVFGDLPRWITKEELEDYDTVTYGYGDQERLYLRGQFTIHKNDPKVNQLWRECSYLSSMDQRFANVIAKKEKLRVESAEGCYSSAILKRNDIKVKYAVKAFTDIDVHDSIHTHGLYQGIGSKRDRSVIYKAREGGDSQALLELSPTWFEDSDNPYGQKKPLQIQVGTKQLLQRSNATKPKCMYWVPEHYQHDICISGVTANETVYWIHGQLYKQPFENVALPGNIQTQPFFHFQEWKRYYRTNQLATVHHSTHAQGWVLVKEGAIPLLPHHDSRSWTAAALHHVGQHNNNNKWKTPIDRKLLPHARYCLRSGRRKHPPSPVVATCFQSISWRNVEIVLEAPVWKHVDVKREVTLALTVQITASNHQALNGVLDVAIANVEAWQGQPCVLVLHVAGATPQSLLHVKNRFASLDTDATLVALIASKESHHVSRKALFNMASDAAPTRWIVSGVEVERGMVLSKEASSVAYRRSKIHGDASTGTILIVPQFAIQDDKDDRIHLSFTDLAQMWRTGTPVLNSPDEYDERCKNAKTQDKNEVFRSVHKLWWRLSTKETAADYVPTSEASFRELALTLDDMQLSFTKLLTMENEKELESLDVSPILMVDSIGPNKGMRTSELAREVEEFGGKQCYNGLRLAQLAALGYSFDVLTSAFAISTSGSRQAAFGHAESDDEASSGSSRCDGCFMFDNDDEKGKSILQYIATDERVRPAKASILWDKIKSSPSYKR